MWEEGYLLQVLPQYIHQSRYFFQLFYPVHQLLQFLLCKASLPGPVKSAEEDDVLALVVDIVFGFFEGLSVWFAVV